MKRVSVAAAGMFRSDFSSSTRQPAGVAAAAQRCGLLPNVYPGCSFKHVSFLQ